ncbi:MAG: beta-ketoacyl-[acyl-carrier-protein] synthase family protein [Victivallales bacterium]|nr:beta-ketoacyl-[acyl-carrier-protein] synthase family protein [Victivallales bacterium]
MKKAVITGRGLVTPLGIGLESNEKALYDGRAGTVFVPEWRDLHLESQVAGMPEQNPECPLIDKKTARFTTPNGKMALAAAYEAINEADLSSELLQNSNVPVIMGSGGSTFVHVHEEGKRLLETGKVKRVTPFIVPRSMNSSAPANISLTLGLTGENYSISSACASGSHAITIAARLIRDGRYDIVITGGTEEVNWLNTLGFDAMKALSRGYNESPERASRPFDRDRDGFVIAGGAGVVVLESEEHAKKRGAAILGVVSGVAANSNATDMVVPDSFSAGAVMRDAVKDAGLTLADIGYLNTHGTATPVGDPVELRAIQHLFGDDAGKVAVNSTKSMTGHMIGATGAVEAIYCSIMLEKHFICPTANLENPEDEFGWVDFVRGESRTNVDVKHALTNSFGFGGTNCALVISAG